MTNSKKFTEHTLSKIEEPNSKPRIVVWGLRKKYHTHRHIHQAFYKCALRLGYDAIWVEDEKKSQKYVRPGDVIIASEVRGRMIPPKKTFEDYFLPVRDDVRYCLHNYGDLFKERLREDAYINLAVYAKWAEEADEKIDTARYFDTKTRTLYQPWGTDLLVHEFKKPAFSRIPVVFWIGSIWNNAKKQGNSETISRFSKILKQNSIWFVPLRFIPNWLNVMLVRFSRLAPAITGAYQEEIAYLPCRMFKNISYGQLGFSNVRKFGDILGEASVKGPAIEDMVRNALSLSKSQYEETVRMQQEAIRAYTYKESLEHIIRLLNR